MTLTAVGSMGPPPSYHWIPPSRAAEVLGVTVRQIYRLIDTGRLPGYRIGAEIKLLAHEVEAFRGQQPEH